MALNSQSMLCSLVSSETNNAFHEQAGASGIRSNKAKWLTMLKLILAYEEPNVLA